MSATRFAKKTHSKSESWRKKWNIFWTAVKGFKQKSDKPPIFDTVKTPPPRSAKEALKPIKPNQ